MKFLIIDVRDLNISELQTATLHKAEKQKRALVKLWVKSRALCQTVSTIIYIMENQSPIVNVGIGAAAATAVWWMLSKQSGANEAARRDAEKVNPAY